MRDGGYYNDWDFSHEFVRDYLSTVGDLGLSRVELGFRFLLNPNHRGAWAYTPDSLVRDTGLPQGVEVGVMIDLKEAARLPISEIERFFPTPSALDFVRIACKFDELQAAEPVIKFLRSTGLKVGLNLMQVSERPRSEINSFAEFTMCHRLDFAYLADSLGGLTPKSTYEIFESVTSLSEIPFGIHAHNNRGLALENTLAAVEAGAVLLDSTMAGMGRGAGNTATEDLVAELQNKGLFELKSGALGVLDDFLTSHMRGLQKQLGWGPSLPYRLASYWGIHPTFVQELEKDARSSGSIVARLEQLRDSEASAFDPALIESTSGRLGSDEKSTFVCTEFLNSRRDHDVVIVGGGHSALEHKVQIERFAREKNLSVLALNKAWPNEVDANFLFRVASKRVASLQAEDSFYKLPGEKILGTHLDEDSQAGNTSSAVPFRVVDGALSIEGDLLITPNDLTLSYALALSIYLGAKNIFLAGVDGYEITDTRNSDIQNVIGIFNLLHPELRLMSLTPTIFSVPIRSPYWGGANA